MAAHIPGIVAPQDAPVPMPRRGMGVPVLSGATGVVAPRGVRASGGLTLQWRRTWGARASTTPKAKKRHRQARCLA